MRTHTHALPPRWSQSSHKRRRALIALAPLIDVVFILLVFFMLASSFLDWHSIDLSPPVQGTAAAPMEGALLVEVRPDGLRLSGESMSLDALGERLRQRVAARPEQRVLVQPAPGVTLQEAVHVLDRLAIAGVTRMALVRKATPDR